MKTINFYKGTELKYSVYANSLEEVQEKPINYFKEYTEDMKITDKVFQNPILKDGELREMTREEMVENGISINLEDGEFIENKKLIKVPKPTENGKYLVWDKEKRFWYLDTENQIKDYFNNIDSLKSETLEYGFDYKAGDKEHRQRCRFKDITLLASNITFMLAEKIIKGKEKPITWYFEDNFGLELNLEQSLILANYGKTFTQSVYDTEHYFKTKVNPKELTKAEFESKRKEIHSNLVNN
ncbi:penicillin-binding protein [Fusobacterium massiliense]|uniref:penicillin-binding protein n=1 Tax=Fusobacterium massiliense TaxID=1852365 RepID=UPI0028D9125F|nr:penicillin-binding protein [Fusobacterium massiliense]